mmetsp:Transcript_44466/g.123698  ORF Transcript_44466/g.123698 Transcript_44466/m.123698 type:complete len:98 (-) Transcript_44466:450-743(-)
MPTGRANIVTGAVTKEAGTAPTINGMQTTGSKPKALELTSPVTNPMYIKGKKSPPTRPQCMPTQKVRHLTTAVPTNVSVLKFARCLMVSGMALRPLL